MNIIQCIVGVVLLGIAWYYISGHQAEQVNFKSGFDGVYKKMQILWEKYSSGKDALVEQQFKLKQQMQELYTSFQQASCGQSIDLKPLQTQLERISQDTVSEFESKQTTYLLITKEYYSLLSQYCQ